MWFYRVSHRSPNPPSAAQYPCAILVRDQWDDFGYKTTYEVTVYRSKGDEVAKGVVKILQVKKQDDGTQSDLPSTKIPERFTQLDDSYCSLGADSRFYKGLLEAGRDVYEPYLEGIRDVIFRPEIGEAFSKVKGFRDSLLRSSEAEKIFHEGGRMFGQKFRRKVFEFEFTTKLPGADEAHRVKFDFRPHPTGLHRTSVLIGRNATGKTQYLAAFARAMSGLAKDGSFAPRRPSFSRVIAVSYSVFDDFRRPLPDDKYESYVYCGIRTPDSEKSPQSLFYTPTQLRAQVVKALGRIHIQKRLEAWRDVLGPLLDRKMPSGSVRVIPEEALAIYDASSSGQRVLIAIMSEIIAHVRDESVVLFDEPELHLHPDAFSALARAVDLLLRKFNSYAIIATHAPLLLQETMARQVRVFRRIGNTPQVATLGVESFGENLSVITSEVFESTGAAHNYRGVLRDLLRDHSAAQIREMFPLGLPLQAEAFLLSLETGE